MRIVIIDDEINLRETNRQLLKNNFPQMEIVGEAGTVDEAIEVLKSTTPDLVLMDVELGDGNCFQVLQNCKPYCFKVIFITAYNQYAIKAIKFSGIDYVLKPVNEFELCNAINEAIIQNRKEELLMQTTHFEEQYSQKQQPENILLRTAEALHIVKISDICHCKSDNNYTTFYTREKKSILVSKCMKEYESLLASYGFIRIHRSFIVNMNAIELVDKTDGGFVILHDKTEIPISKRRKQHLIEALEDFTD